MNNQPNKSVRTNCKPANKVAEVNPVYDTTFKMENTMNASAIPASDISLTAEEINARLAEKHKEAFKEHAEARHADPVWPAGWATTARAEAIEKPGIEAAPTEDETKPAPKKREYNPCEIEFKQGRNSLHSVTSGLRSWLAWDEEKKIGQLAIGYEGADPNVYRETHDSMIDGKLEVLGYLNAARAFISAKTPFYGGYGLLTTHPELFIGSEGEQPYVIRRTSTRRNQDGYKVGGFAAIANIKGSMVKYLKTMTFRDVEWSHSTIYPNLVYGLYILEDGSLFIGNPWNGKSRALFDFFRDGGGLRMTYALALSSLKVGHVFFVVDVVSIALGLTGRRISVFARETML